MCLSSFNINFLWTECVQKLRILTEIYKKHNLLGVSIRKHMRMFYIYTINCLCKNKNIIKNQCTSVQNWIQLSMPRDNLDHDNDTSSHKLALVEYAKKTDTDMSLIQNSFDFTCIIYLYHLLSKLKTKYLYLIKHHIPK